LSWNLSKAELVQHVWLRFQTNLRDHLQAAVPASPMLP
jgi:hypothetical protein